MTTYYGISTGATGNYGVGDLVESTNISRNNLELVLDGESVFSVFTIVDNKPVTVELFRDTCYACNNEWGKCVCQTSEDDPEKFEFNGVSIVDERVSDCGRFFVEPTLYYGEAFLTYQKSITTTK